MTSTTPTKSMDDPTAPTKCLDDDENPLDFDKFKWTKLKSAVDSFFSNPSKINSEKLQRFIDCHRPTSSKR